MKNAQCKVFYVFATNDQQFSLPPTFKCNTTSSHSQTNIICKFVGIYDCERFVENTCYMKSFLLDQSEGLFLSSLLTVMVHVHLL